MTLKEQAQRLLDAKQTWRYPRITSFSADHVKIECEDQGGWPFTAFEYSGSNADRRAVDFLLVLAGELKLEMDGYRLRVSLCGADGRWETMSVPGPYVSPLNRPKEDP